MTDKQIIIDGVDVSECCAFSKHREGYCGWYTPCEGDSCSYKLDWALEQLKAKEQECERLKILKDETYFRLKDEYKQQLDQLKAKEQEYHFNTLKIIALQEALEQYETENEELKEKINSLICSVNCYKYKQAEKYKQTLTEIKEIATHCIKQDICTTCDNSEKCHIEDEEIPTYDVCKLILQKISECEGNDG